MEDNYQPLQAAIQQTLVACVSPETLKSQVQAAVEEAANAYFADIYKEIDQLQSEIAQKKSEMNRAISTMTQEVEPSIEGCKKKASQLRFTIDRIMKGTSAIELSSDDSSSLINSEGRYKALREMVYQSADKVLPITVQSIEPCGSMLQVQLLNSQLFTVENAVLRMSAEGLTVAEVPLPRLKGAESTGVRCPVPVGARKVSLCVNIAGKLSSRVYEQDFSV